ncbi:hypothetical protein GCM10009760_46130 [Kitasatospora kazusensis]|uniref:Cytochrome P450 n=1 Tax=Kitasatospora kazusensis TaxID=407974 RepID=A0ABN3A186_9ACTN
MATEAPRLTLPSTDSGTRTAVRSAPEAAACPAAGAPGGRPGDATVGSPLGATTATTTTPTATATAVLPPELGEDRVAAWQGSGRQLIALLTEARELGPVSRFRLGGRQTLLVTGPEQVQHVLAQHPDRYVKRSHRARPLLGDGVVCASGQAWKDQRRLLQPQFTSTGLRRHEHRIAGAARAAAGRWAAKARTGEPTDVGEDMRLFALDAVWRCLTGLALDEDTRRELASVEAVVAALPTADAGPEAGRAAMAADLARIDASAERAIATVRGLAAGLAAGPGEAAGAGEPTRPGEAAATGETAGAEQDGTGLLHLLLETAKSRPEYTDRLIRDELVTLLVAGHETTAQTLAWLFLLLDRHPEVREWLAAADRPDSPVGRGEALHALVSETLRLYPAVWLIPRHAPADDVLDGYRVEAGSDILICPYLTHRDPGLWPDPERFDPTRFLTAGRRPVRPGAYYPFGVGGRACLGLRFAMRTTAVLLDLLLPHYMPVFRSTPDGAVFGADLRPDGPMPARIEVRRP